MAGKARVSASVVALASVFLAGPSAAQAFDAHGSARQVYVTGLAASAPVTLIKPDGKQRTRTASALGGRLFRGVKPGDGYRVSSGGQTSGPLTVLSNASAPPSTDVYDQTLPSSG